MTKTNIQTNFINSNQTTDALRQQGPDYARLLTVAPSGPCEGQMSIRILRLPEVMEKVGLCRASIYVQIKSSSFPKQISLGARAVGWLEHEIEAWLIARIAESNRVIQDT